MTDVLITAVCETRGTEPLYTGTVQDFEKHEGPGCGFVWTDSVVQVAHLRHLASGHRVSGVGAGRLYVAGTSA